MPRSSSDQAGSKQATPEIHFQVAGNKRLHINPRGNRARALPYLDQQIRRRPTDLRLHTQRIMLLLDTQEGARLAGALADLFIALGDAGLPLKQRCLRLAAPALSAAHLALFKRAAGAGFRATDPALADIRHSVLNLGFRGQATLVTRRDSAGSSYANTYDEAIACLEYAQLEEARRVLEDAIRRTDPDPRVSQLLLEIYQRTGDTDAFHAMRDWLAEHHGNLPAGWQAAVPTGTASHVTP